MAYAKARDVGEALFLANPKDPATGHELVRTLGNLGICLRDTGRRDEALVAFDWAREVLKVAGGANPTLIMFRADSAWIDTAPPKPSSRSGEIRRPSSHSSAPGRPARCSSRRTQP